MQNFSAMQIFRPFLLTVAVGSAKTETVKTNSQRPMTKRTCPIGGSVLHNLQL